VAVLDGGVGFARRHEELVEEHEVQLAAAAVELPAVEVVLDERVHVALDLPRALLGVGAVVAAAAVVAVKARREAQAVRVVRHVLEGGEASVVHERLAVDAVVVHAGRRVRRAARLPVVVETHIAVPEVAERGGLAVDHPLLLQHAVHDALDQRLVHVVAVEVPRAPAQRRRARLAVVVRERSARQGSECEGLQHRIGLSSKFSEKSAHRTKHKGTRQPGCQRLASVHAHKNFIGS